MTKLLTPPSDLVISPTIHSPESAVNNSSAVTNQTEETRFFCASMLEESTCASLYAEYVANNKNPYQLIAALHALLDDLGIQRRRLDVWDAHAKVLDVANV